jgi:AsmA protein
VSLTDGIIELDQSKIAFLSRVKDFAKPDIAIDMSIDNIDIDRYLPPDVPKESAEGGPASSARKKNKFDYGLLRKPVINMEIRAGKIKVKGARARDVFVKVRGKDGVFTVNPFELKAYQGNVDANAVLDVRAEKPKANVNVDVANMMIRPLLNDLMKKDFLEGTTKTKLALTMEGDDFDAIKRTLNGEGNLHLTDGAIR